MDELAEGVGRDPRSIQLTIFGVDADLSEVKQYEEAGADRVIVNLSTTLETEGLAALEKIAQQVLPA